MFKQTRMLASILALSALLCFVNTNAQVAGIKTVGGSSPDYLTLAQAIDSINAQGVGTGGLILEVAAGHTENMANKTIATNTTSATNPLVIRKSGFAANPLFTADAGTGTLDGILKISGSDYVTIESLDFQDNAANTTTTTRMEWGIALLRTSATDGVQHAVIRNCTITLIRNHTTGIGIYSANHTALSNTAVGTSAITGTHSNLLLTGNTVINAYTGISVVGATATSAYDFDNRIAENTITNFGGTSTASNGILANNQQRVFIYNNTLVSGTGTTGTLTGISTPTGTSSDVTIRKNKITLFSSATTSSVYGINNAIGSTAAGNAVTIDSNEVFNSVWSNASTGDFYGINNNATAANVYIANNKVFGNRVVFTSSGIFYGIYGQASLGTGNLTIHRNEVSGNSKAGSSGAFYAIRATTATILMTENAISNDSVLTGSGALYGYYNGSSPVLETYQRNVISNLINNGTGLITGMQLSTASGLKIVSNNQLFQFSGAAAVNGFMASYGAPLSVYQNDIYALNSSGSGGVVTGINASGTDNMIFNNHVYGLTAPASSNANAIMGINLSGGTTHSVNYNTVFIEGTSSATQFGTSAIHVSTSPTRVVLRNNMFINNTTPVGTAYAAAYRRSTATLTNYSDSSSGNMFYAGNLTGRRVIFFDGTGADSSLTAYKTRMVTRDQTSVYELPPFINTLTIPYDLHLNAGIATQAEGSGVPISFITTDKDNQPRNATTPDIGADEGNFIAMDAATPLFTATPVSHTTSTANRVLTQFAAIADPSGVDTALGSRPRIYFKKKSEANVFAGNTSMDNGWKYIESNGNTSPFSFTIDYSLLTTTANLWDTIQYFVVAQDRSPLINTGALPGNGFVASSVANIVSAPITPFEYIIISGPVSGTITVGPTGNQATLTQAINYLNTVGVSGAVTLELISNQYDTLTESFPIIINEISGVQSGSPLTIKPANGVNTNIVAKSTAAIILNGADYVTIDGSNNGTNSVNLTITNLSNATTSSVVWLNHTATGGATNNTIKNCNVFGFSNVTTFAAIGIASSAVSTSSRGVDNDYNTIENCELKRAQYGIYTSGASATNKTIGTRLLNNKIRSAAPDNIQIAGILSSFEDSIQIRSNIISEMSRGTDVAGIILGNNVAFGSTTTTASEVSNALISKNIIGNVVSTGAFSSAGIFVSPASTGTTVVDHNVIYGVRANATGSDFVAGIFAIGDTGSVKIYYNSISITGSGTRSSPSYAIAIGGKTHPLEIRNNIMLNSSTTSGADFSYALGFNYTNLSGVVSDHNLLFTSGANAKFTIIGDLDGGTEQADINAWRTASGKDASSVQANPIFVSATDLRPDVSSPALLAGTVLPGFTTDVMQAARSLTTPTIGAYENPIDLSAPAITYTSIANTTSLANLNLTNFAAIADGSGINTTNGLAPRIYYKKRSEQNVFGVNNNTVDGWKWVQANNTTSPFSFQLDYSLLFSTVTVGDTIQYFVVAQDNSVNANTGSNPSAGFSATNVGSIVSAPSNPSQYIIVNAPMNGVYTVGNSGTFTTLTEAKNNLELRGMNGNVELQIVSNLTEAGAVVFPQITEFGAGNYTLTIKPTVTSTISASVANSGVIVLAGTDRVVIDGRIGTLATNELTIINTNTTTTAKSGILVSSLGTNQGCNQITIRNVNLEMATTANINISAIQVQGDNNHAVSILQNQIKKTGLGIQVMATTTPAGTHQNMLISGNQIGGQIASDIVAFGGIRVSAAQVTVSNNTIFNITNNTTTSSFGIELGDHTAGGIVTANKIHNITNSATSGAGAYGIHISGSTSNNGIEISNNSITRIARTNFSTSSTISNPFGIRLNGGTRHKVVFNSVHLYGNSVTGGSTGTLSAALMISNAGCDSLVVQNNIFANKYIGASGSRSFAIYAISGATFTTINRNNYDTTGAGSFGRIGFFASEVNTIPAFRALTGQDGQSFAATSMFTNDSNLMIVSGPTPNQLESGAAVVAGITTDINGEARPKTIPTNFGGNTDGDIGAYEFDGAPSDLISPSISYTNLPLATNSTSNVVLNQFATIVDAATGVDTTGLSPRLYYKKKSDANVYVGNSSSDNGWKYATATNLSSPFSFVIDYSILNGGSVAVGDTIQYFVTAQDYAGNVSALPASGFSAASVSAITTFPTTPNQYVIAGLPMSGNYTVGTLGNYQTLTAARNDLELRGVNGAVNLLLTDATYSTGESFPIVFRNINGLSASNRLTIKPDAGVTATIIGSASSIIQLLNSNYITIDGSNNGSQSRNLSIINTSTATNTAVVWLSGTTTGSSFNTIKNVNLMAGVDQRSATSVTFGILVNGATIGVGTSGIDNDENQFENNVITRVRYGIFLSAASGTNPNTSNRILSNTIGPNAFGAEQIGRAGIVLHNSVNNNVHKNVIRYVGTLISDAASGSDKAGIVLATDAAWTPTTTTVYGSRITANHIYEVVEEKAFSAIGIIVAGTNAGDSTGNVIANNMIAQIRSNGTSADQAIGIGLAAGNTDSVLYNSISLSGDMDPFGTVASNVSSYGLRISSTSVEHPLVMNNIISVDINSNTGTLLHGAVNIPASYNWGSGRMNYNNLSVNGANTQMQIGSTGTTFQSSIAAWRTATGMDLQSSSVGVQFVSSTDLHLSGTSVNDFALRATPVTGFATDFDNDTRHVIPYMGADEVAGSPLPVQLISFNANNRNGDVQLNWKTASELNNSGFAVEVSVDGKLFKHVTFVQASSKVNGAAYLYTDSRAFINNASQVLYYRLKQVDLNGEYNYSSVVRVDQANANQWNVKVYPNPSTGLFSIHTGMSEMNNLSITVTDLNGREVYHQVVKSLDTTTDLAVDLTNENTGIYFVKVRWNDEVKVVKLIKQ